MQRYDEYKYSGIEWIGEIPKDWEVKKLKYCLRAKITDGPHETPEFLSDGIPFLSVDGIQKGELVFDDCRKISEEDFIRYQQKCKIEKNDILMGKAASIGKIAQVKTDIQFTIWSPLALIKPSFEVLNPTFLEYFLKSEYAQFNLFQLSTFNTQRNISMQDIPKLFLILPKESEQQKIVNYLNKKITEIDELIAQKEQLLAFYEEEIEAIINQAVTKGIDLDVMIKESVFPWIGKIPEHWEVIPIKYALEIPITDGPHETPEILNKGIPFLSAEAVKNDKLDFDKKRGYISQEDHERFTMKYKPKIGDVYMVKSGATTGNLAKVETDEEFSIWSPLAALRPKKDFMTTDFLFYFMKSKSFFHSVVLGWNYGTQQNIGMGVIANLRIIHPPEEEQNLIVKYITKELSIISKKIEKTKKIIALQKEYRTSLISEVVTGKIKVTEEI